MTDDSYERGYLAGEVKARLSAHDAHFAAINGTIDRLRGSVDQMNLNIEQLTEANKRWSPLQRVAATVGATLTTVASVAGASAIFFHTH